MSQFYFFTGATMNHKLLNPLEACNWLGISRRKLGLLVKSGILPSIKIGRCLRFAMADLIAFSKAHRNLNV
jgi:excisionase family DNA binding protein